MTSIEVVNASRDSAEESRAFFPRGFGVTALLSALAVAVFAFPGAVPVLEFDRGRLGELWRIVTSHFTHYDLSHLFWDCAMFAALGVVIEKRSRRLLVACVAVSAVAIPAAVALWEPGIATYRGLSGVDSALFVLATGLLVREACSERRWGRLVVLSVLGVGFVGKIVFELVTGDTVFVDSSSFTPLPLAHVVGAAVGLVLVSRTVPGTTFSSSER